MSVRNKLGLFVTVLFSVSGNGRKPSRQRDELKQPVPLFVKCHSKGFQNDAAVNKILQDEIEKKHWAV